MKREFDYTNRAGVKCVSVNFHVAKRRENGGKSPVIGKLVNGKLVPSNYYGKI
jgi:hypothetical protein